VLRGLMQERSLFDNPVGRGPSNEKIRFDEVASRPAYEKAAVLKGNTVQHQLVMALDKHPMICEELETLTGRSHQSVSAALNALLKKGLAEKSGMVESTSTGCTANIWILSLKGKGEADRWNGLRF